MGRELTKNEFMIVRKGYENGLEMYEMGYFKECLLELKPVLKLLERDKTATRILAKVYLLQGQCFSALMQKDKAIHVWKLALETLEKIHDKTDLKEEVSRLLL